MRVNKKIKNVFANIVGDDYHISDYDQFINEGFSNKDAAPFFEEYKDEINKNKKLFMKLALLEEIIMQSRMRADMDNIKLVNVNEYVYARLPFFRRETKNNEIRVLLEKSLTDCKELEMNNNFMAKAKEQLSLVIDDVVKQNIEYYNDNYK